MTFLKIGDMILKDAIIHPLCMTTKEENVFFDVCNVLFIYLIYDMTKGEFGHSGHFAYELRGTLCMLTKEENKM